MAILAQAIQPSATTAASVRSWAAKCACPILSQAIPVGMVPAARAAIAALLAWSAEAARHEDLSNSLLEAGSRADAEVHSKSGKNVFDDFFADPASFSKPGPVDGDTSCGMWCRNMGSGSKVGEWSIWFGDSRIWFGDDPRNPVSAYSFNGGENLVVQWSGKQSYDAEQFAPTFGGWAKVQLMVSGAIMEDLAEKGAYRVSPDLGMGDDEHAVFGKMCAPGGTGGKTHKYAIPLQWDGMREMGWLGFPREVLLKHYYRGAGKHMELLPQDDVTIAECADTSNTEVFRNDPPGTCHSKEELEQLLKDVDGDLEKDPSALTDGPKAISSRGWSISAPVNRRWDGRKPQRTTSSASSEASSKAPQDRPPMRRRGWQR